MRKLVLLIIAITLFVGCASNDRARRADPVPGPSVASTGKPVSQIYDYKPGEASDSDAAVGASASGTSGSSTDSNSSQQPK
ncbi:MAG: hypothetical protein ACXW32_05745 [Limisphaerales bacterium]